MLPNYNILPPSGWHTQSAFQIKRLETEQLPIYITALSYDLDLSGSTGTGTLTVAYDENFYEQIRTDDEFHLYWGWSKNGDLPLFDYSKFDELAKTTGYELVLEFLEGIDATTEYIPIIITGYIKDIKQTAATIQIDFNDKGVLLEKKDTLTYQGRSLLEVCVDITNRAGLNLVVDWESDNKINKLVNYPNTTSATPTASAAATTSATIPSEPLSTDNTPDSAADQSSGTICTTNSHRDAGGHCTSATYAADGQHCFENICPVCGLSGHLIQSVKVAGQITCKKPPGCDSDFCGKTGICLKDNSCSPRLTPAGASTPGTQSTSSGTSYWDILVSVLDFPDTDVMMYVHLDTLFILKVPDESNIKLFIDDRMNVIKDSVTITYPTENQTNTIVVDYSKKAVGEKVTVQHPDMVKKYGVQKIELKEYGLSYDKALSFALTQLQKADRTNGLSIDLTVVGTPYFYPCGWSSVNLTRYNFSRTLFVTKYSLNLTAGKTPTADITLQDYFPALTVTTDSTDANAGTGTPTTIAEIMEADNKYHDCQGNKFSYINANADYGCSNCWGNSYWLYSKLTAAGIKARIVCGNGGCKSSGAGHRWVQYSLDGKTWVDMPYDNVHHYGAAGRTVDGILPHPEDGTGNGM